jgi:hypothetical protein
MIRWQRLVWLTVLVLVVFLMLPEVALADNCGSLYDCWGTASAAAAAAVGAGAAAGVAAGVLGGNGEATGEVEPLPPVEAGDDPEDDYCE